MPFLADENSRDKLLKNPHIELGNAIDPASLKAWGWHDFRNHDCPDTLVSTALAAAAFIHLSIENSGAWRKNKVVLHAIIAFLGRYHVDHPRLDQLRQLKQLLDVPLVDTEAIRAWFIATYPPDPAPED